MTANSRPVLATSTQPMLLQNRRGKVRRFFTLWMVVTFLAGLATFGAIYFASGEIGAAQANNAPVQTENLAPNGNGDSPANALALSDEQSADESDSLAPQGEGVQVAQAGTPTRVPLIAPPTTASEGQGAGEAAPAAQESPSPAPSPTVVPTINAPEVQGTLPSYPDFILGAHIANFEADPNHPMWAAMGVSKMDWAKMQIRYERGMNPDDYGWMIQVANSHGYGLMFSVVGHREDLYEEGYMEEYADFVGHLAMIGMQGIEVWNEANIDREWPNGRIGGEAYTELLRLSYEAIKANNPDTLVISAGPAPTGAAGPQQTACSQNAAICNDDVWYEELAEAGAADYMDCVGAHYNEGVVSPTQTSGDSTRNPYPTLYLETNTERVIAPFEERGIDIPVCYTELGYLTGEGYGEISQYFWWAEAANVTLQQQATWLATAALINAQSGKVKMMIVWNLDFAGYDPDDPKAGYAMVRSDGACPACDSFGTLRPDR